MKDFADLDNTVGTFPNVQSQDCSGPGATDGTPVLSETINDDWGWKQALFYEFSDTPNDATETSTASQIFDLLQLLLKRYRIPLFLGFSYDYVTTSFQWRYNAGDQESDSDYGPIYFALYPLPPVTITLTIEINVTPGAARSGSDRMSASLFYKATGSPVQIGSTVYDDGTANTQNLDLSQSGITPSMANTYFIRVTSGSSGSAARDRINGINIEKSKS